MPSHCQCGSDAGERHVLGCVDCGAACCPACAIHLESVTYCARCASALLETTTVRAGGPLQLL